VPRVINAVKIFLFAFICAAILLTAGRHTEAATDSSRAIAPPRPDIPYYIFADFQDVKKIAPRLQRSELLGLLDADSGMPLLEMIRNFSDGQISLMTTDDDLSFQMSWKCGEAELLDKIEKGTASGEEAAGIFGRAGAEFFSGITPPSGPSEPNYRLPQGHPYFTAYDGLLILGDSAESVTKSLVAVTHSGRRYNVKTQTSGDVTLLLSFGEKLTGEFLSNFDIVDNDYNEKTAGKRLDVEIGASPVRDGWDFDIATNANEFIAEGGFDRRSSSVDSLPFFRAGGGELVAMLDFTVDLGQKIGTKDGKTLLECVCEAMAPGSEGLGALRNIVYMLLAGTGNSAQSTEEDTDILLEALSSPNRFNAAVTADRENPLEYRAYAMMSSEIPGASLGIGRILANLIELYNEMSSGSSDFEMVDVDGWESVYTMRTPMEGLTGAPAHLTLAFGDSGILVGFIAPSLLSEKFSSGSELFRNVSAGETPEKIYLDMSAVRKLARVIAMSDLLSPRQRQSISQMMLPFIDIQEISAHSTAANHILINAKTSGLDSLERDYYREVLK
jgi:hypothetical protein